MMVLVAGANAAQSLRATANKMFKKVDRAFLTKNMDLFESATRPCVTDDFKYTEEGKSQGYDAMLSEMRQSFAMIKRIKSAHVTVLSLKQHGDEATMRIRHQMTGTTIGPDHKAHTMTMSGVSTNEWRKQDGAWKMATFEWAKQQMTMDGKAFDPSQMGGGK